MNISDELKSKIINDFKAQEKSLLKHIQSKVDEINSRYLYVPFHSGFVVDFAVY